MLCGAYFCMSGAYAVPSCPEVSKDECEKITGCVSTYTGCRHCAPNTYCDKSVTPITCTPCPSHTPYSALGSMDGISDCKPATTQCNTVDSLKDLCGNNGTVFGTAQWNETDLSTGYDYGTCTCATDNVDIKDGDKTIGKGEKTCKFSI